jgi:AcrR family transcriptional regulator
MQADRQRRTMNPAAKQSAVLLAASDLFARNGYDKTSIADVAAQANVAVGSVYRLFADKRALLTAVHNVVEDAFIDAIQTGWAVGGELDARTAAIAAGLFETASDLRDIVSILAEQRGGGKDLTGTSIRIVNAIADIIQRGIDEGMIAPQPVAAKAEIAHGMVAGAMTGCFMREEPGDVSAYVGITGPALAALLRL